MKLRCMDGMRQGKVRLSRDYEIKLSAHSSTLHLADVPGVPAGVYLPIDSGNRHHFPADVVLMDTQLARAIFQSSSSAATTSIPTGKQHYLPHELDALIIEEDRLPEIRQLNCEPLTAQDWQVIVRVFPPPLTLIHHSHNAVG
jgi:hypothetical protein